MGFWAPPIAAAAVLALMSLPDPVRPTLSAPPTFRGLAAFGDPASAGPHIGSIATALFLALALGAALRLGLLAIRFHALARVRIQASRPLPREARAIVRASMPKPLLPVRLSDKVAEPILIGIRRPVIVLPARLGTLAAAEAAALVCRHEAMHAAHHDNLRLLLEEVVSALFWFNPVQRALRLRLSAAREERCDLAVIARLGPEARQLYARTLVESLRLRPSLHPTTGFIGLSRRHAAMRISSILRPAPQRPRRLLLATTLGIVSATAVLAAGIAAAEPPRAAATPAANGPVDIRADALLDKKDGVMVWTGRVTATGVLGAGTEIVVDGERAPGAVDLATFGSGKIAALKVTQPKRPGDRLRVEIVTY